MQDSPLPVPPSNSDASHSAQPGSDAPPKLVIRHSDGLIEWMASNRISLVVSTYQASRVLLIGLDPSNRLAISHAFYPRSMGLCVDDQRLWIATANQVWRLENVLSGTLADTEFDRRYVAVHGINTGEVFIHDLGVGQDGTLYFANTAFSCVAASTSNRNFEVVWQPPFTQQLVPEDVCHLNGLAMRDGQPYAATVCGMSSDRKGWREDRVGRGAVMRISDNAVLCDQLTMPHSPRVEGDELYVLDSGTAAFGRVRNGKLERLRICSGFARGLDIWNGHAIVGLSKPRRIHAFDCLPLGDELQKRELAPRCGIQIFDLSDESICHSLSFDSGIDEMYDVRVIPNVRRASISGIHPQEIAANVWFSLRTSGEDSGWIDRRLMTNRQTAGEMPDQAKQRSRR